MRITIDKAKASVENGKVIIDFDSAQLENFLNINKVRLSTLSPRDEFMIGDETFIILEQSDKGAKVISKEYAHGGKAFVFGNCTDWKESYIRTLLNDDYYDEIAKLVGASNIISMERDLTSLDGLNDYGTCTDKVSLLTAAEYAKYHKILGLKPDYPEPWWIITSDSTPSNELPLDVCIVNNYGSFSMHNCHCSFPIRPILNLRPSILVSSVKYVKGDAINKGQ